MLPLDLMTEWLFWLRNCHPLAQPPVYVIPYFPRTNHVNVEQYKPGLLRQPDQQGDEKVGTSYQQDKRPLHIQVWCCDGYGKHGKLKEWGVRRSQSYKPGIFTILFLHRCDFYRKRLIATCPLNTFTRRIDSVLKEMGQTSLCELPDQTAWTIEQFLSRTEVNLAGHFYRLSSSYLCRYHATTIRYFWIWAN